MAMACLRLLTVLPLRPLFNVPLLRLCSALFTSFEARQWPFCFAFLSWHSTSLCLDSGAKALSVPLNGSQTR